MHRHSRQWYDLLMLTEHASGKAAIDNRELFEDVVRHKQIFYNSAYANYEACLANELRLIPDAEVVAELRTDRFLFIWRY